MALHPKQTNQNQLARMESNYIPKKYTKVNTTKMKDNYILINIPKLIKTKGNCIPNINHTKNQSEWMVIISQNKYTKINLPK